jgi:hypothetical protein
MFSFLKRKAQLTEADFDVMSDVTAHGVTLKKAEIVRIFMDWTQEPSGMTKSQLGRKIADRCDEFRAKFAAMTMADRDVYGSIFAQSVIEQLKSAKMLKNAGRKTAAEFLISPRGEQIRQFYVLKLNLRGSLYDRMDRFQAA